MSSGCEIASRPLGAACSIFAAFANRVAVNTLPLAEATEPLSAPVAAMAIPASAAVATAPIVIRLRALPMPILLCVAAATGAGGSRRPGTRARPR